MDDAAPINQNIFNEEDGTTTSFPLHTWQIVDVPRDGDCGFACIAALQYNDEEQHLQVREEICNHANYGGTDGLEPRRSSRL